MEFKDYYKTLGVRRDASQEEVKKAYRRMARKYHPDVSTEANAEERLKTINEAYEVLKDPEKRSLYDRLGANWRQGEQFRPPPDWGGFDPRQRPGGVGGGGARGPSFSDFFESLFGGAGMGGTAGASGASARGFHARQGALRGQDEHARLEVDPRDAFHGVTRMVELQVTEPTPGGALRPRTRRLKVKIPAGITTGQRIRLAGQGGPGLGGGPAGDLLLEVVIKPDRLFQVEGRDVLLALPVAPWEAALGASVSVPTLAGAVDMKIPPGSQSGQKLRLRGRGLPGKPPGDQLVELRIVAPPADTEAKRELYRRMERELRFDPRADLPKP